MRDSKASHEACMSLACLARRFISPITAFSPSVLPAWMHWLAADSRASTLQSVTALALRSRARCRAFLSAGVSAEPVDGRPTPRRSTAVSSAAFGRILVFMNSFYVTVTHKSSCAAGAQKNKPSTHCCYWAFLGALFAQGDGSLSASGERTSACLGSSPKTERS